MSDEPSGELVKVAHVARVLGVCPRTVRRWVQSGDISGRLQGKRWYVHRSAFEALRDPMEKTSGRPSN